MKKVAITNLNASTRDILNTIRANAPLEYQQLVPKVEKETDIPKVGDVLYGYPSLSNYFISTLVNRIALVRVKSATFNNAYASLKKGYLEFGETVEEVFVNIVKARTFDVEKADARELKRTLPDVKTAFHAMNWRVQYPVTIQNDELRSAFQSYEGVEDLIAKIVDSVYTANEYDEYLLFKYLMIKAITKGKMYPVTVSEDIKDSAVAFRSASNGLTFMSNKYNVANVLTTTPKARQNIFMSADYNAQFDVNVLASAFNMDKADFVGKLRLIDDWTTFDNERFSALTDSSDMIEPITQAELNAMQDVIGVLIDDDWFQVYDNLMQFSEKYVASGLYWNYFLNVWKTVSTSPFANAVVFTKDNVKMPNEITVEITDKLISENATILTLTPNFDEVTLTGGALEFEQNELATTNGIAVHKYGAIIFPAGNNTELTVTAMCNGNYYTASTTISTANAVGNTITLEKN